MDNSRGKIITKEAYIEEIQRRSKLEEAITTMGINGAMSHNLAQSDDIILIGKDRRSIEEEISSERSGIQGFGNKSKKNKIRRNFKKRSDQSNRRIPIPKGSELQLSRSEHKLEKLR